MLLYAPVWFIRQSALNMKVVRDGQISRIVGTSRGGSTLRFRSKTTRFRPWAVRKATTSGVSNWLVPESIEKIRREGMSHPSDCSKNSDMKPRNESCCKLDRRRGKFDAEPSMAHS